MRFDELRRSGRRAGGRALASVLAGAAAVVLLSQVSASAAPDGAPPSEPRAALEGRVDLATLRDVVVQDGGRRKPLDTLAREQVRVIFGYGSFNHEDPLYTFLSMLLEPDRWEAIPAFRIHYGKLIDMFRPGFQGRSLEVSLAEISGNEAFGKALAAIDPEDRMPGMLEGRVLELHHRRLQLQGLAMVVRVAPLPGASENDAWSSLATLEEQPEELRHAVHAALRDAAQAWRADDAAAVNRSFAALAAKIREVQAPLVPSRWKIDLECALNVWRPLWIGAGLLVLSALFLGIGVLVFKRRGAIYGAGLATLLAGVGISVAALAARTIIVERAPVSNIFEATSFAVVTAVLVATIFELIHRDALFGALGAVFGALGVILINAAGMDAAIEPLVPVLRSYWLNIHVTCMLVSYAVFSIGFMLSVYYLAKWFVAHGLHWATVALPILVAASGLARLFYFGSVHEMPKLPDYLLALVVTPAAAMGLTWAIVRTRRGRKIGYEHGLELKTIERYLHRVCMVGFLVITTGIILGAVWANESWGRYWGWDPKETWAFISWMIYAVYVHGRIAGWFRGISAVVATTIGYNAVLFTFFGVSYVLPGLHSYLKS